MNRGAYRKTKNLTDITLKILKQKPQFYFNKPLDRSGPDYSVFGIYVCRGVSGEVSWWGFSGKNS